MYGHCTGTVGALHGHCGSLGNGAHCTSQAAVDCVQRVCRHHGSFFERLGGIVCCSLDARLQQRDALTGCPQQKQQESNGSSNSSRPPTSNSSPHLYNLVRGTCLFNIIVSSWRRLAKHLHSERAAMHQRISVWMVKEQAAQSSMCRPLARQARQEKCLSAPGAFRIACGRPFKVPVPHDDSSAKVSPSPNR